MSRDVLAAVLDATVPVLVLVLTVPYQAGSVKPPVLLPTLRQEAFSDGADRGRVAVVGRWHLGVSFSLGIRLVVARVYFYLASASSVRDSDEPLIRMIRVVFLLA
jgi:hypothetical protein